MLSRSPVTSRRPAGFIDPCLPTLARAVPDGPLWAHEIKHDGDRFICQRDGDRVRAFTRRGHDWTDRVPAIAAALGSLRIEMLKNQGMSNRAIAHRLGVSEKAVRKLVGPSQPAESAQLALAEITTAAGKPPTTRVSSAKSTGDADRATPSAEDRAGDRNPITAPVDDGEAAPMSLDRDASDRTFDRQLAYLGLLDDAAPLFGEGSSVPGVGVLFALPCLAWISTDRNWPNAGGR